MKKTNEIPHAELVEKFLPSVPQFGLRKPVPIDAALDGNVLTIVFEDGRKLEFDTMARPVAVPTEEETIIGKAEAKIEVARANILKAKADKAAADKEKLKESHEKRPSSETIKDLQQSKGRP